MTTTAERLTKEALKRYRELRDKKSAIEREARTIGKELDQIAELCLAELTSAGKDSIRRHGFQLSLVEGRATVAWKDEFIRVAGAEEANLIQASATPTKRLEVVALET